MDRSHRHDYSDLSSTEDEDEANGYSSDASTSESIGVYCDYENRKNKSVQYPNTISSTTKHRNLILKLFNREYSGKIHSNLRLKQPFIETVPKGLSFCLKDIVPTACLLGHTFMGLSSCGQFLFSYRVCSSDPSISTLPHFSLNTTYKYRLFFWIYQPHKRLRLFHHCCLFDDHSVDSLKEVTMVQWKCSDPRILVIHGASRDHNEDSYITYVKVPKLGCKDCKKLRDADGEDDVFRRFTLCLKCNLTVHTKYTRTDSYIKFDPYIQMICPGRILIVSNGFLHMLHIHIHQPIVIHEHQFNDNQKQQQIAESSQISTPALLVKALTNDDDCDTAILIPNIKTEDRGVKIPFGRCVSGGVDDDINDKNVIARIIEDFTDIETDSTYSGCGGGGGSGSGSGSGDNASIAIKSPLTSTHNLCHTKKSDEELVVNCHKKNCNPSRGGISNNPSIVPSSNIHKNNINNNNNHIPQNKTATTQRHRIVTKPFRRRGVYAFFTNSISDGPSTSATSNGENSAAPVSTAHNCNNDRASAYEFSEDNEKCEKISILRKRRLADRKYEFSDDNSENIKPFTIKRTSNCFTSFLSPASAGLSGGAGAAGENQLLRSGISHNLHNGSPYASPSSSPHSYVSNNGSIQYDVPRCRTASTQLSPRHCSPLGGSPLSFRSPPSTSAGTMSNANSPIPARSPNRHHSNVNCGYSCSAAAQYMLSFKSSSTLSPLQLSMTKRSLEAITGSVSPTFLSPRRDEWRTVEVPLQGAAMSEKPLCTKKFQRRYVEEDDAASVITSEGDDCISPGYHTLLPLEVHGSCYSEMQMISKASYQRLRCTSVIIDQHSFDLEMFTYYVIATLCQKHEESFDYIIDWAYEIINICPLTSTVFCILIAHFECRPKSDAPYWNDFIKVMVSALNRRQYECRVLFSWNMVSGEWDVLDFGELYENDATGDLSERAKRLTVEMAQTFNVLPDYTSNLRVLDSNIKKSKDSIIDLDNLVEFSLRRQNNDITPT